MLRSFTRGCNSCSLTNIFIRIQSLCYRPTYAQIHIHWHICLLRIYSYTFVTYIRSPSRSRFLFNTVMYFPLWSTFQAWSAYVPIEKMSDGWFLSSGDLQQKIGRVDHKQDAKIEISLTESSSFGKVSILCCNCTLDCPFIIMRHNQWRQMLTVTSLQATFLCVRLRANGSNIVDQQLPTLLDVTCCVRLHTLLHVVGCCYVLLWNRSNISTNNSQHFFCSVVAEALRNNVGYVCTALPTLLGPRTLITNGLQRLMGCILPMMQCRSQHCWRNNVGSCCVRLHAA